MLSFEDVSKLARSWPERALIAIDGLPLAGKSTLAERLSLEVGAHCLFLDDFVRPEVDWPSRERPSFPFEFVRYDAFLAAVRGLAAHGACVFDAFDWETGLMDPAPRKLRRDRPVIVEGVSALHPELAPLYDVRIWVESDPATTLAASIGRGVGGWAEPWERLFLPSVALYLETRPRTRADLIAAGRGARSTAQAAS